MSLAEYITNWTSCGDGIVNYQDVPSKTSSNAKKPTNSGNNSAKLNGIKTHEQTNEQCCCKTHWTRRWIMSLAGNIFVISLWMYKSY